MKEINHLTVKYHGRIVGVLAETKDGFGAFQYDNEWLREGFSISPFSLPLEDRVFLPKSDVFEGLFGVFSDSLPDGWGRILVDRMLLAKGIRPQNVELMCRRFAFFRLKRARDTSGYGGLTVRTVKRYT